ncbi:MAG: hypothetical protein CL731_07150 [Chloroflexi bacterium]|nr:hypothetical protein [Chloroflexota bacterium]
MGVIKREAVRSGSIDTRMTQANNNYFQQVKASSRMFGFLGLMLGVTGGVLTGVAVKGLVDEPVVSGGGAVAFYGAFALSSLITLYVMLNYLSMSLRLSGDKLDIRLGMKSAIVHLDDMKEVRVATPASRMARAATQARPDRRSIAKMWSVLGVKTGIELDLQNSDGDVETWFVASLDPESLQEKIQAVIYEPAVSDAET